MNAVIRGLVTTFGAVALTVSIAPGALASCAVSTLPKPHPAAFQLQHSQAWRMNAALADALTVSDDAAPIVGMWHTTFTATTMNAAPIPDTTIDSALVVWHSDKTEIMNSGRPPQDGNFCMGVWESTGKSTYKLNHFAWGANAYAPGTPNGVVGDAIGPVHYIESVTLSPDGNHYAGTFSLVEYDTSGNVAISFTGVLTATRITVDTKVEDLL